MPEIADAPVQTEQQTTAATETVAFNPFDEKSWVTAPAETVAPKPAETIAVTATETAAAAKEAEQIFDENDYVKNKFGFESAEDAINQIKLLREAKDKGFEFPNDDSRRTFEYLKEGKEEELYNILDQKRKVNKLLSAEKVDKDIASQMVKMGMQTKYKDLTTEEIDYKFNKLYSIPPKPVQDPVNESDEDYAVKLQAWESRAKEAEMDLIIEAKLSKPELEKLKSELVLPDISRKAPESEAQSQESLAEMQKVRENFLAKLNSGYTAFKGYETKVADESGDIPVTFVVPEEERVIQKGKVEKIELDLFFNKRWFDENNNPNVEKIMADLYFLENQEKVFQGIANNAANQKLVAYIKKTSNITVDGTPKGTMQVDTAASNREQQIKHIWENS